MTDREVEYTDEVCDNCGSGIIKIEPEEGTEDLPHDVAYICDPDTGCGVVDRYE